MSMSHDEMIALIQAHKEGKEIQYFRGGDWRNIRSISPDASFNFGIYNYRIKPEEPKVIWVNEYDGYYVAHDDKDYAHKNSGNNVIRAAVKYQEVIE